VKILLIDNFDSFTYNLSHYLEGLGAEVVVIRENEYSKELLKNMDGIVLSPGPGLPSESEGMMSCLADAFGEIPILGVCLGMQAMVEYTGGKLFNQEKVKHGIQEYIDKKGDSNLLKGISNRFQVGLYHSWAVQLQENSVFQSTSMSATGIVMSIESVENKLFGVQFHPESVMTPEGKNILKNFLEQ
jgi:anthranilate synthase component 2